MNEIRYYLNAMKNLLEQTPEEDVTPFKPTYLVTAVKLPTGAIELAINNVNIPEKISYILEAYDDDMRLKTNSAIEMVQLMVV